VVPKHDALLAIDKVDANREALQDGAMDFRVVDHRARPFPLCRQADREEQKALV
jgi:hypothetical protein